MSYKLSPKDIGETMDGILAIIEDLKIDLSELESNDEKYEVYFNNLVALAAAVNICNLRLVDAMLCKMDISMQFRTFVLCYAREYKSKNDPGHKMW